MEEAVMGLYYWEVEDPEQQYVYEYTFAMLSQGLLSVQQTLTPEIIHSAYEGFAETRHLCTRDAEMYTDQIDAMLFDISDGESCGDWMIEDVIILWLMLLPFNGVITPE